jgi:hypothetical protein
MKARLFRLPSGQLQIFVDEGSFEEAQTFTRTVLAQLQAKGIPAELVGKIEQHRDDVTHVHVQHDVSQKQ